MRFDLPDEKKLTHEMVIPIRWGDMDAMGHVNNTIYFRYLEIVRIEWLHAASAARPTRRRGPGDRQRLLQLHPPARVPGRRAGASTTSADPGRSSFDTYITLERTDQPGVIHAEGGAKTVLDRLQGAEVGADAGLDADPRRVAGQLSRL